MREHRARIGTTISSGQRDERLSRAAAVHSCSSWPNSSFSACCIIPLVTYSPPSLVITTTAEHQEDNSPFGLCLEFIFKIIHFQYPHQGAPLRRGTRFFHRHPRTAPHRTRWAGLENTQTLPHLSPPRSPKRDPLARRQIRPPLQRQHRTGPPPGAYALPKPGLPKPA